MGVSGHPKIWIDAKENPARVMSRIAAHVTRCCYRQEVLASTTTSILQVVPQRCTDNGMNLTKMSCACMNTLGTYLSTTASKLLARVD